MKTLVMLLFCIAAGTAFAQEEDYQKWLKEEEQKFQQYKEERDKEFTEFLKKEWRGMQLMGGIKADEKPKPVKLPVISTPPPRVKDTVKTPPVQVPPPPREIPKSTPPPPSVEPEKNPLQVTVAFYDMTFVVRHDNTIKVPLGNQIDKESISAYWSALSRSNFEDVLAQAKFEREKLKLNDWGYCELLERIGAAINNDALNSGTLFAWFMLSKSGYEARVGYANNKVYLMLPAKNNLYGIPYFTFSGKGAKKYYAVPVSKQVGQAGTELFTYEGNYEGADKTFDFGITQIPQLADASGQKTLRFIWDGKNVPVPVTFRKDAVEFFEFYPQTNFEVYFAAPVSSEVSQSLLNTLRPMVQGKSELEAVNLLLRFVQTAFQYKTDQEQFGREKPLLPDETVFYPASDCEDRAVLFAFLVRNLIGLDVVGLDYPGHIATAVRFPAQLPGDQVMVQGKKFMVCDPTYINATAGMAMPQFKTVTPNIIAIGRTP
jgi:hypothetical protein